ncbi:MAG: hypothetical protein ACKVW3_16560 [Phycisphaerales bacterium]
MSNLSSLRFASGHHRGSGLLISSAIILLVLIALQATRLGTPVKADLVSSAGGLTVLTVAASSQDMLLVLDNRAEELMVYRVENQNAVELHNRYNLPRIFAEARNKTLGKGR